MPLNSQRAVAHVKHFHLLQPLPQLQHLGNAGRHGGKKYTELTVKS